MLNKTPISIVCECHPKVYLKLSSMFTMDDYKMFLED